MQLKHLLFLALLSAPVWAQAQLRTGFKTGLNFATVQGPSEVNDAGVNLETNDNTTGFHIGATFSYSIIDMFGLRGELIYSRKGFKNAYDGQTFRNFGGTATTGTGKYLISITNSYIDIPVMAYVRFKDFELSAGPYAAFLIQSTGQGSLQYSGRTPPPLQNAVNNVEIFFDHNYLRDKPGGVGDGSENITVRVDGRTLELPKTVGAYYDLTEDKGNLYNRLDYGLVGGLTYYLSRSLYAGARLQYGLADLTNNDVDVSRLKPGTNNTPILRNDRDRNFTWQASIGFSF
jgi:Outer membrane protein beta-barrel domain